MSKVPWCPQGLSSCMAKKKVLNYCKAVGWAFSRWMCIVIYCRRSRNNFFFFLIPQYSLKMNWVRRHQEGTLLGRKETLHVGIKFWSIGNCLCWRSYQIFTYSQALFICKPFSVIPSPIQNWYSLYMLDVPWEFTPVASKKKKNCFLTSGNRSQYTFIY